MLKSTKAVLAATAFILFKNADKLGNCTVPKKENKKKNVVPKPDKNSDIECYNALEESQKCVQELNNRNKELSHENLVLDMTNKKLVDENVYLKSKLESTPTVPLDANRLKALEEENRVLSMKNEALANSLRESHKHEKELEQLYTANFRSRIISGNF